MVRYVCQRKLKGEITLFKTNKVFSQGVLLAVGVVMICYGAMRGEVESVLSKAIRLCLECVGIG